MGYSPWGLKESDTTERLTHTHIHTHTYGLRGLPLWLSLKESACNAGDAGSIFGPGSKIPHAVRQLNPSSSTTEPAHHD